MDMNRLTQKSQEALQNAQTTAMRFGHTEVDRLEAALRRSGVRSEQPPWT
ncbi:MULTISPECIES: hypothetical protein [Streptomyces]|nr:hypothetical protein [Streptomyces sp. AgN23]QTI88098.1 hypothetical protein AS97_45475 [Streptomyces sp. AgN23]WTA80395.1 hypothetical protein OG751_10835 [Streptomyces antimycoticus]